MINYNNPRITGITTDIKETEKKLQRWSDHMVGTLDTMITAEHYNNESEADKIYISFLGGEVEKFNNYLLELINHRIFLLDLLEEVKKKQHKITLDSCA